MFPVWRSPWVTPRSFISMNKFSMVERKLVTKESATWPRFLAMKSFKSLPSTNSEIRTTQSTPESTSFQSSICCSNLTTALFVSEFAFRTSALQISFPPSPITKFARGMTLQAQSRVIKSEWPLKTWPSFPLFTKFRITMSVLPGRDLFRNQSAFTTGAVNAANGGGPIDWNCDGSSNSVGLTANVNGDWTETGTELPPCHEVTELPVY